MRQGGRRVQVELWISEDQPTLSLLSRSKEYSRLLIHGVCKEERGCLVGPRDWTTLAPLSDPKRNILKILAQDIVDSKVYIANLKVQSIICFDDSQLM